MRTGVLARCLLVVCCLSSFEALAYEVLAIGTSNTNCKNVDRSRSFTAHLQELLRAKGQDATVINAGVDGDKPQWMVNRLPGLINEHTKLVIFEPGPNDRNKSSNIEYSEKILEYLQTRKMPTIYISHIFIQQGAEGKATADKFGAYYYGHWNQGIPLDRTHYQYDLRGPGHLTAEGCQLVAEQLLPLVEKVLLPQ